MLTKRLLSAAIPLTALAIALAPGIASADIGGPVALVSPNTSSIGGVEVAGVNTGGASYTCAFTNEAMGVQTCVLPVGFGVGAPVSAAPGASGGPVAVAGVQVSSTGEPNFTCLFSAEAPGPQTCVIQH